MTDGIVERLVAEQEAIDGLEAEVEKKKAGMVPAQAKVRRAIGVGSGWSLPKMSFGGLSHTKLGAMAALVVLFSLAALLSPVVTAILVAAIAALLAVTLLK